MPSSSYPSLSKRRFTDHHNDRAKYLFINHMWRSECSSVFLPSGVWICFYVQETMDMSELLSVSINLLNRIMALSLID